MVKIRSDKVLECLNSPEFPKDSEMVVYIHKLLRVIFIINILWNLQ